MTETTWHHGTDWRSLLARPGFRYLFAAMFISLFGTGMNYSGVTWYILEQTNSTLSVSLMVIFVTLPGLIVPPFGGVLIDRVDRRYLGMTLDLLRGLMVLGVAALVFWGQAGLGTIYAMVLLLGTGFAVYWSTVNALLQEVVPHGALLGANAAILIAVQTGMMTAGMLVGFIYYRAGIAGVLAIDGATYLAAACCLFLLRHGHIHPHAHAHPAFVPLQAPATAEDEEEEAELPPIVEPGIVTGFLADLMEGLRYLRDQPRVFSLGLTYACMMAGVLSANVLIVALARDILRTGPHGYGFMQAGWALGAVAGGFLSAGLLRRLRPFTVLLAALATLAAGHMLFPYVRWLALAVAMHATFGCCRALSSVLTQSSIMSIVPHRLMGRIQSAFSVISTLLQVAMSFTLGWLAQHVNLPIAFLALGVLYAVAVVAAFRARLLATRAPA